MGEIPPSAKSWACRECVCFCYPWEIWVSTTNCRLEESSVLCSQGNTRWKRIQEKVFSFLKWFVGGEL